jgi:response regulator RpfG family c-di-GMP phosphodiesterase
MNKHKHNVLIVDDEKQISTALGRIFKKNDIDFFCCTSGEAGIKKLNNTESPFSLILSDQRMPGMTGIDFLEKAKKISPATIRVLISGYSDNDVLIDAINKGIIQKFIQKPWEINDLINVVKKGFQRFNNAFENERFVRLAKKQNKKLYQLDYNLNERVKKYKQKIVELDRKIEGLKNKVGKQNDSEKCFEEWIKQHNMLDSNNLKVLLKGNLDTLFEKFKEIAGENDFTMPGVN